MKEYKEFIHFDPILRAISRVKEVIGLKVVRRPLNYVTWQIKGNRLDVYLPVTDRYLERAALRVSFSLKNGTIREIKRIASVIWRFVFYYSVFPYEMIKTMLSSSSVEDLIFYLMKSTLFYLDMDEASFLLLAENQKSVERAFTMTREATSLTEYRSSARLDRGLSKRVIEEKTPVIIKDIYFEEDINPKIVEKARRSIVAYPILYEDRVIAILYTNSKRVREVDERLILFLEDSFKVIGVQLYRMLLNERYKDTIEKLSLLNKISSVVVKKEKVDDATVGEILAMLKKHLKLLQIAILVPEGDKLVVKAEHGYSIDKERFSLNIFGKGITPYVFITGEKYYSPDVRFDDKYFFYDRRVRSEAAFPLYRGGRVVGVLNVTSDRINAFSEKDLSLLESVADIISLALVRSFSFEKYEKDSRLDPLTGLKNRRALEYEVPSILKDVKYASATCAFVLIDLDGFKKFNDTYGHSRGDEVLKKFGKIILDSIRAYDIAIRYGGDEFLIVLPGIQLNTVGIVLDRIRSSIKEIYPELDFSYGVASYPENGTTLKELLEFADSALYENKKEKKNTKRSS